MDVYSAYSTYSIYLLATFNVPAAHFKNSPVFASESPSGVVATTISYVTERCGLRHL